MATSGEALHRQVMDEHLARLERLAERRGVTRMRRIYDEAQAEVVARLARLVRAGRGDSFTGFQLRLIAAQLTDGQAMVMRRLGGELRDAARDAQTDTLRALTRDLGRLEQKFSGATPVLPVEDAARFAGVIDHRATSLMQRHRSSLERYGAANVARIEDALAKSLLQGESTTQAVDRIGDVVDVQWWQGERIARTELAWASNATQADGLEAAREEIPDMMMQWRELVNDVGRPLDDRVGVDSLAMHGQVVRPGETFLTPPRAPSGEQVGDSLAYDEVPFPPNRPNDRAVVSPWRAAWGIPGWRWVRGRRVPVR